MNSEFGIDFHSEYFCYLRLKILSQFWATAGYVFI